MRYFWVALLVLGIALPLEARQVVGDKVADTSVIQVLDLVVSDKGHEITIEVLNVPQAYSTEPIRLQITGVPCCTNAYAFIAINVAGTDIPVYVGHSFKESALFAIPAPPAGWQPGAYPIKVVISLSYNPFTMQDGKLTYVSSRFSSLCSLNIEVEEILIVVKSPPPSYCPPSPPKSPSPLLCCGFLIGILSFLMLNWLLCGL